MVILAQASCEPLPASLAFYNKQALSARPRRSGAVDARELKKRWRRNRAKKGGPTRERKSPAGHPNADSSSMLATRSVAPIGRPKSSGLWLRMRCGGQGSRECESQSPLGSPSVPPDRPVERRYSVMQLDGNIAQ